MARSIERNETTTAKSGCNKSSQHNDDDGDDDGSDVGDYKDKDVAADNGVCEETEAIEVVMIMMTLLLIMMNILRC